MAKAYFLFTHGRFNGGVVVQTSRCDQRDSDMSFVVTMHNLRWNNPLWRSKQIQIHGVMIQECNDGVQLHLKSVID